MDHFLTYRMDFTEIGVSKFSVKRSAYQLLSQLTLPTSTFQLETV